MEMRYFYAVDQVKNKHFTVFWQPGAEILADYPSKHHDAKHHQNVRPYYLHERNSPQVLPRALPPREMREIQARKAGKSQQIRDRRGCVGISAKAPMGYALGRPLPIIPKGRSQLPRGSKRSKTGTETQTFPFESKPV